MRNEMQEVTVEQQGSNWVVRVTCGKRAQTFSCHSKRVAQRFAAVFEQAAETMAMAA